MAIYQPYYGSEDLSEEERRRRQLIAQGLLQGQDLGTIAGNVIDNRLQGFQTGLQDRLQQARVFMPGEQEPTEIRQAVAPIVPGQMPPEPTPTPQPQAIQMPPPPTGLPAAVQVAGPAQAPTTTPAPTMPAETPAPWQQDITKLDFNNARQMYAFAAREDLPDDARNLVGEMLQKMHKKDIDSKSAMDVLTRFAQGDKNAVNTVMRDVNKKTDEGSFLKAILYARLGLNELALEEQRKLGSTDTKIGQMALDGRSYTVETNARTGAVTRAWDSSGTRMGDDLLAKLSAGGLKPGGQRYAWTGEPRIITDPATGDQIEIRQRTDSVAGKVENIIVGGPRQGQVYSESAAGAMPLSVQSALTKMDYGVLTDLQKKHAGNVLDALAEYQKLKGPLDQAGTQAFMQAYQYGRVVPTTRPTTLTGQPTPVAATPAATPAAGVITRQVPQRTVPAGQAVTAPVAPAGAAAATGGITTPIAQLQSQQRVRERAQTESIQTQEERIRAEQKPPAEEAGKVEAKKIAKQAFSDNAYPLLGEIGKLIKQSTGSGIGAKADVLAAQLGASTTGSQAIRQLEVLAAPLVQMVPRFEGAQSDRDVQMYVRQAGDFSNPDKPVKDRLAALQGMIKLLKVYDIENRNDWTFGEQRKQNKTSTGVNWSVK